jgi:hypothetical protein
MKKNFRVEGTYVDDNGERVALAKIIEADDRLQLAMDTLDKYTDLENLEVTEV